MCIPYAYWANCFNWFGYYEAKCDDEVLISSHTSLCVDMDYFSASERKAALVLMRMTSSYN